MAAWSKIGPLAAACLVAAGCAGRENRPAAPARPSLASCSRPLGGVRFAEGEATPGVLTALGLPSVEPLLERLATVTGCFQPVGDDPDGADFKMTVNLAWDEGRPADKGWTGAVLGAVSLAEPDPRVRVVLNLTEARTAIPVADAGGEAGRDGGIPDGILDPGDAALSPFAASPGGRIAAAALTAAFDDAVRQMRAMLPEPPKPATPVVAESAPVPAAVPPVPAPVAAEAPPVAAEVPVPAQEAVPAAVPAITAEDLLDAPAAEAAVAPETTEGSLPAMTRIASGRSEPTPVAAEPPAPVPGPVAAETPAPVAAAPASEPAPTAAEAAAAATLSPARVGAFPAAWVANGAVTVRTRPTLEADLLTRLPAGTGLWLTGRDADGGAWVEIILGERRGWVMTHYVAPGR